MAHTIIGSGAGSVATPASPPPHATLADTPELDLLRLTLNQVDYGLVVLNVDNHRITFANVPGWAALDSAMDGHGQRRNHAGLCLVHGRLATIRPGHAEPLRVALARTRFGLRGLLSLDGGPQTSSVAVLPLPQPGQDGEHPQTVPQACYALLVFAKQQLCDDSTVALFARERGLTSAEGQVLAQVCKGLRPAQIAHHHGVQVSTVRTQLRSIRMKTCSETIRELVQKVSVLPPMARHLSPGATTTA